MLQSVPPPQGFALDEHHQPHITVLQRHVRTGDLDAVYDAIRAVLGSVDLATLAFTAAAIRHMEVGTPGVGLSGIIVKPGPEVLEFQSRLIDALAPFTGSGGTADAYVRTDAEPEINDTTLDYIEHYVPAHSGENYLAHVTVGLATLQQRHRRQAPEELGRLNPRVRLGISGGFGVRDGAQSFRLLRRDDRCAAAWRPVLTDSLDPVARLGRSTGQGGTGKPCRPDVGHTRRESPGKNASSCRPPSPGSRRSSARGSWVPPSGASESWPTSRSLSWQR
jgi:hypothetical protein